MNKFFLFGFIFILIFSFGCLEGNESGPSGESMGWLSRWFAPAQYTLNISGRTGDWSPTVISMTQNKRYVISDARTPPSEICFNDYRPWYWDPCYDGRAYSPFYGWCNPQYPYLCSYIDYVNAFPQDCLTGEDPFNGLGTHLCSHASVVFKVGELDDCVFEGSNKNCFCFSRGLASPMQFIPDVSGRLHVMVNDGCPSNNLGFYTIKLIEFNR
ncbi:MAG: hypothetical protein ABIA76_02020 [Candidatus Diapherotrites archaeon]